MWRLILLAISVCSLLILTYYREGLDNEFNVRYMQCWMIYGIISTLTATIILLLLPDVSGLVNFLEASVGPFSITIGVLYLSKFQLNRTQSLQKRRQESTITLSEMVEKAEDKSGIGFISITKILIDPSFEPPTTCPGCGLKLDFREKYDWYGPTAFTCPYCKRITHIEEIDL